MKVETFRDDLLARGLGLLGYLVRSVLGQFQTTMLVDHGTPVWEDVRLFLNTFPSVGKVGVFEGLVVQAGGAVLLPGVGLLRKVSASVGNAPVADSTPQPLLPVGRHRPERSAQLVPMFSEGTQILRWEGRLLWVCEEVRTITDQAYERKIRVTMPGACRESMERFLRAAIDHGTQIRRNRRTIYVSNVDHGGWSPLRSRDFRPLDSVILPGGLERDLLADADRFLSSRARYAALGLPYRRGYLLEGIPGSGKSSLAEAIAGELGLDLYVLSLAEGLSDYGLRCALAGVESPAVVVIEDIDAGMPSRGVPIEVKDQAKGPIGNGALSLSGILNALDGPLAADGRLLFMTTNCPEALDPALIRPGRVDRRIHFGPATQEQCARLFERFFPEYAGPLAGRFGDYLAPLSIGMAEVQALLQAHMDDVHGALAAASDRVQGVQI